MTLFELNRLVREAIEDSMAREYWVEAEVAECREARGHCYLELIEKDEQTATPIAKASAKYWASKWALVKPYFERTTGQRLVAGMKVLLRVYPQFHEAFGFRPYLYPRGYGAAAPGDYPSVEGGGGI